MSKISVTTTVDAPRSVVWDLVTDLGRMHEYLTTADEIVDLSPTPVDEGTSWREVTRIGPLRTTGNWEIVEMDEPHRLKIHGEAMGAEATVVLYLTAIDEDRTRLKQVIVYEFLPDAGLLGEFLDWAVVHRVMARETIRSMDNFRTMAAGHARETTVDSSSEAADREPTDSEAEVESES